MSNTIIIKEKLSKEHVSFESIEEAAANIELDRKDFYVNDVAKNMWMDTDGTISFCPYNPLEDEETTENMPATPWALGQLSTKLGMPSVYAEKCINAGHADLAAHNINTWLTDQNGNKRKSSTDYLVRSYQDNISAVLSSGYTTFDTSKILESVKHSINIDDYHIVGSHVSNERMHLRMIRDEMLNIDGEDLYPAIFIDSSDVGRTALHVSFGIWKKVCTNGLCISKIGGVLYHQRHLGISSVDVETELVARMKMIPELTIRSAAVIEVAKKDKIDLHDENVFNRMMAEVRRLSKVSEESAKKIIELAKTRYGMSRWGIVNSMTEVAQEFELDERIRIENAAGLLIVA